MPSSSASLPGGGFIVGWLSFSESVPLTPSLLPQHPLLHHVSTHSEASGNPVPKGYSGIGHTNHEES